MMPEEFFKKNIEMWEKFTTSYMDTMFKTVEKTVDQSQAMSGQVSKLVEEAVAQQTNATMMMLETMQRQMQTLTEKVDELLAKASTE